MINVNQLAAYEESQDYARLAELAKRSSIICLVDHELRRDVARTQYARNGSEEFWTVGARGISYVHATNAEEFAALCERHNVGFLEPPAETEAGAGARPA